VLALSLRAWRLQGQSLSSDEIVEASVARLTPAQIIAYPDGFPPLYQLLLSVFAHVSPSPESSRWLSVIAGVATVYFIYRWARQQIGEHAALVAGGLAAVSPLLIYFSQEARAYSLYVAFTTASLAFFFQALKTDDRRSWAVFVIATTLNFYTHYYAAPAAALLGLLLLYYRPHWAELRRGLTAFAAIACLCFPVVLLLPGDMDYQVDGYVAKAPLLATLGHTAFAFFGGFSLGPSLNELHTLPMREAMNAAASWAAIFTPAALWLMAHGWRELRRRRFGGGIVFLALASAPVIGIAGALADVGPKVRYWSWIVAPLLVWLAAGAARPASGLARWITRLALAAIVLVNLAALANRSENPRYANEDLRSAADYLKSAARNKAPVFVISDYMAPPVRYYLNGPATLCNWLPYVEPSCGQDLPGEAWVIHPRSEADVRGSLPLDDAAMEKWVGDLKSLAGADGQFWFIYTRPFHGDHDGKLLKYLTDRHWVTLEREFAEVQLYRGHISTAD
jgi:4-amino-4-deoxy-L-arabinose transferase-like glycosyltransferase